MRDYLKHFEKLVVVALIAMMCVVVLVSTVGLGWIVVRDLLTPPILFFEIEELLDIFGFFLLILIGLELLETIRAYLDNHVVHVEIVLEVALIAIARKVIVLDLKDYSSVTILGIAALILTLGVAYFLEHHTRQSGPRNPE
jgi:uncharacterized membrane protein (DUF373 family)